MTNEVKRLNVFRRLAEYEDYAIDELRNKALSDSSRRDQAYVDFDSATKVLDYIEPINDQYTLNSVKISNFIEDIAGRLTLNFSEYDNYQLVTSYTTTVVDGIDQTSAVTTIGTIFTTDYDTVYKNKLDNAQTQTLELSNIYEKKVFIREDITDTEINTILNNVLNGDWSVINV